MEYEGGKLLLKNHIYFSTVISDQVLICHVKSLMDKIHNLVIYRYQQSDNKNHPAYFHKHSAL